MSDPRNVAHDKKVQQEKENHAPTSEDAKPKKGRSDHAAHEDSPAPGATSKEEQGPGELEKSVAVLSKLKEMEFHSRANIETLAGLTLTIDDELKQKEFIDPIGNLYAAQNAFETQIAALVTSYEAKCESLKPSS
ncbi:MAG: hypothetical protein ABI883_06380 [Chthoniobacterales bacterium]